MKRVSWLVLAAAVSACGGGGGGGGGSGGAVTYSLSGMVSSAFDDSAIPGVAISLTGAGTASTTTNASGRYTFSGLANGTYTVSAMLTDAVFFPDSIAVTVAGGNVGDGDFLALRGQLAGSGIEFLPQFFSSSEQLRVSLHVADGQLVYTDSSDAQLKRQALDGAPPAPLANRFESAESVVRHAGSTYWVAGGNLHRMDPGGSITMLAEGLRGTDADVTANIVVDGTHAYWVDEATTQTCSPPCNWVIEKIPLNGGAAIELATADRRIAALAIDADNLYWEEDSVEPLDPGCNCGSKILSVPKSGGNPVLLVDGSLNGNLPPVPPGFTPGSWQPTGGIALTAGDVVFAVSGGSTYEIWSVAKGGGNLTSRATVNTPAGLARSATMDVTVAGNDILWLDTGNADLKSLPLGGGAVATRVAGLVNASGLTVSSTTAYWTESGAYSGCCLVMGAGSVRRVALSGGGAATMVSNLDKPGAVSADETNVVWTEPWRIGRAPGNGGAATTLVSGIADDMPRIAVSQAQVYVLDGEYVKAVPLAGGSIEKVSAAGNGAIGDFSVLPGDITADDNNVYWTMRDVTGSTTVRQLATTGGNAIVIAGAGGATNPQDCYRRIAVSGPTVYWSEGSTTHPVGCVIRAVPVNGGSVTTLIDQDYMVDFTVDGVHVYFSEFATNSIRRLPVGGGAGTLVASDVYAWVLENDAENLYWLDLQRANPGGMAKSDGPADWINFPIGIEMDPLLAFEGLLIGPTGFYVSETQTGSIYRIY